MFVDYILLRDNRFIIWFVVDKNELVSAIYHEDQYLEVFNILSRKTFVDYLNNHKLQIKKIRED